MGNEARPSLDVLLVQPPLRLPDPFANYPSLADLGLLMQAAVLRERGHRVRVVDALIGDNDQLPLKRTGKGLRLGLPVSRLRGSLKQERADAVVLAASLYASPRYYENTALPGLIRALRRAQPGAALILADLHVGGVDYLPYDPVALLRDEPALDFAVPGEGELSVPALLEGAVAGAGTGIPASVAYRRGGRAMLRRGAENRITDLDSLPVPAFDLVGGRAYLEHQARAAAADLIHEHPEPRLSLPLLTSRGCPFACRFCASRSGTAWRGHSPAYVRDRLVPLARELGAEQLLLLDDCLNASPRRFTAIAEILADAQLPWDALNGIRGDRIPGRALRAMVRAGCPKLTTSAESGDPAVLENQIGKRLDLGKLERNVAAASRAGLPAQVHYLIGLPRETRPQINRTLEHAAGMAERHGAEPLVQFATPVPGTELHRECVRRNCLTHDPDDLDLLSLFEMRSLIRGKHFEPDELVAFRAALERRLASRRDPMLMLEVTTACNDRCTFCSAARRKLATPSLAELTGRLQQAAAQGRRAVDLDGGEPTLHPELPAVIGTARELGYERIDLVTNARRAAYRGYARSLVRAGLTGALVSMPSANPETHDRLTRVPGAFAQASAGLDNLRNAGLQTVIGNVVLCREALPDLGHTIRWLAGRGVDRIHLQAALDLGAARRNGSVPPWPEVRRALDRLPATKVPLTLHNVPACRLAGRLGRRFTAETCKRGRLRVDARGRGKDFGRFLARMRVHTQKCEGCVHRVACDGFWRWDAPSGGAA